MAIEIKMPRLSQTTDEVKLLGWLVGEGDKVNRGEPICEVETDKVTMNVESFEGGTVLKLITESDAIVDAGTVIAILGDPGEKIPERYGTPGSTAGSTIAKSSTIGGKDRALSIPTQKVQSADMEHDGMRVTKRDLEGYIAPGPSEPVVEQEQAGAEYELTLHQKAIARNMAKSKSEIPHYYLKTVVVADSLLRWREGHLGKSGTAVSINSFIIYAAARTLLQMPKLNGYFKDYKLILNNGFHIGFAVARGDELHVPVVKDAHSKGVEEIDKEVKWLIAKVQNGKLEQNDLSGGSFTITNLGTYPVDEFSAIINPPQSGILAVGRMKKTLMIAPDNSMNIQTVCTVTGSFDHRIVNGAQGAAFLEKFKEIVEEF
jgi:pyruvate dehydrogenase E2 component (dihydrolipoamide acetyltransferase)